MKTVQFEISGPLGPAQVVGGLDRKVRVNAGALVTQRDFVTIFGKPISVPDPERCVHLQFRRFAGCPLCDLHLRSFAKRHEDLARAGIREVVLFHSPLKELVLHASNLPFAVIADPHKQIYTEFGVEGSVRSLLDPRAWAAIAQAAPLRLWEMMMGRKSTPSFRNTGGRLGLPADFLIAGDG